MNYILDTNILLIYLRNSQISTRIENEYSFFSNRNNLAISVVTVGEIKSIAKQQNYGSSKIKVLDRLLSNLAIVDIHIKEIIERYAEIDAYSQGKIGKVNFSARNMGKNDLWIAATSSFYDLTLVTTDNDFKHLDKSYLRLESININEYK
jgi:tRNA(fMet)-specific endonuclease VapC